MRKWVIAGAVLTAVACGSGEAVDMMGDAMQAAGDMLADAGEAIADAGQMMADAGDGADAMAPPGADGGRDSGEGRDGGGQQVGEGGAPPLATRTLEAPCDEEYGRTLANTDPPRQTFTSTVFYARFEGIELGRVVTRVQCGNVAFGDTSADCPADGWDTCEAAGDGFRPTANCSDAFGALQVGADVLIGCGSRVISTADAAPLTESGNRAETVTVIVLE